MTVEHQNGDRYVGQVTIPQRGQAGVPDGQGKMTYADGREYDGC